MKIEPIEEKLMNNEDDLFFEKDVKINDNAVEEAKSELQVNQTVVVGIDSMKTVSKEDDFRSAPHVKASSTEKGEWYNLEKLGTGCPLNIVFFLKML